jgi:hypothetical protein
MLIFAVSNAQTLVWENTFDTPAEIAGWQFYDGNNNNNTWNVGKHVVRQSSANMYTEVSPDHVLRYSRFVPNVTGGPANLKPDYVNDFEDWAISPEIDLTGASGTITLAAMVGRVIAYNTTSASNNTYRDIFVYESTPTKPVPDVTDFQAIRSAKITAYGSPGYTQLARLNITNAEYIAENNALFAQATADLSQYAGKKIYIGFWHNVNNSDRPQGNTIQPPFNDANASVTFQIDNIEVYADVYTLATKDVKAKTALAVYPNPATDVLNLKSVTKANVTIYNSTGQVVARQTVTNGQLNVSVLTKGVYTLSIEINGVISTTKFIKK